MFRRRSCAPRAPSLAGRLARWSVAAKFIVTPCGKSSAVDRQAATRNAGAHHWGAGKSRRRISRRRRGTSQAVVIFYNAGKLQIGVLRPVRARARGKFWEWSTRRIERKRMARPRERVRLEDGLNLDLNRLIQHRLVRPGMAWGSTIIWSLRHSGRQTAVGASLRI